MGSTGCSGRMPRCAPPIRRAFASKVTSRRRPEAAALSKAPMFAAPVPLVGRFSLGGGNPMASDGQKDNVRGIAMHFQLPDGSVSDLLLISAPIFVAKTPEQFLELLQTVATEGQGPRSTPSSRPIPDSTRQKALAQGARDAGELRHRPTISGCTPSSDQRQGRSPAGQMEGGAGRRLQRPHRRGRGGKGHGFLRGRAQRPVRQGPGRASICSPSSASRAIRTTIRRPNGRPTARA